MRQEHFASTLSIYSPVGTVAICQLGTMPIRLNSPEENVVAVSAGPLAALWGVPCGTWSRVLV